MKKILTFGFLVLVIAAQAQIKKRGLMNEYNLEHYPEVSFIWNTANPDPMDNSKFVLTVDDVEIPFNCMMERNNDAKSFDKNILILWEDMYIHKNQTENTRQLLLKFFDQTTFNPGDRFNIAVFNRIEPGERDHLLKLFQSDFIQDIYQLKNRIMQHPSSKKTYKEPYSRESDLYSAIEDGIEILKKEGVERTGVIVVVTAGLNLKAPGATTEMGLIKERALESGIPIYVVKYHEYGGDTPEINTLAKSTYGDVIKMTNERIDEAVNDLQDMYKRMDARYYGQDYKFSFRTTAPKDGKPHKVELLVDTKQQRIQPFIAPKTTFGEWVKEHLILCAAIVILVIGLIVLIIVLAVKSKRNNQGQINKLKEEQRKLDEEKKESDRRQRELEDALNKKIGADAAETERMAQEKAFAQMLQQMKAKNMFPRLQCNVGGKTTTSYTIRKPVTKIGRNACDNDVVLNDRTVSGYHANIEFTGSAFEVVNKSSTYTQGVIVNGQFFQRATLKSGDVIGLGESTVTFYV